MGMMDWMDGHDEEESSDSPNKTVATDGLGFDEGLDDLSDEFGDFGDGDGFEDGDEFGEGGDFGGGGGGSVDESVAAELEDRISDLENELNAVSSGMNTVQEENEQIGETVEELDDTIRKLLDVYEMVTRGINPFVDDASEMSGLEGDGSFGIFEGEEEGDERLDPDVANAEDELTEDEPSDGGGGESSFDELKSQYEEDGWDDELDDGDEESDPDATPDEQSQAFEFDHDAAAETSERTEPAPSQPRQQTGRRADASDGPEYLTTLPASYIAESVVLEWARFLVSVGGAIGAERALRQYREQEWISRHVERKMNAHVRNAASATATEEPRDLRVEHHKESLTYISRLADDVAESRLLEELSAHGRGGGHRGLRR